MRHSQAFTWARNLFAACTVFAAACAGGGSTTVLPGLPESSLPPGVLARGKITHVVIIVQENRTFDDIFGGFPGGPTPYPNADSVIPADMRASMQQGDFHVSPPYTGHDKFRCLQINGFSSATWQQIATGPWPSNCPTAPPPNPYADYKSDPNALTYIPGIGSGLPDRDTYWNIAQTYEIGDRYFAVNSTNSFPGHQFIVSLQSMNDRSQEIADQPAVASPDTPDCFSQPDPTATVNTPVLGADGFTDWKSEDMGGACWDHTTFADRMNQAGVSWTNYITDPSNGVFDGFINFKKYADLTRGWPQSQYDALPSFKLGILDQFTWVKPPCIWLSDHPGNNYTGGQEWVGAVINAIGENPLLWKNTVIFVVWDDWGGFYDHVTPPPTRPDGLGPGMREPFLVISPYGAGAGAVVHTTADYASVIRFVEELYGIAPVNSIDGTAGELSGFFDFSRAPAPFVPIAHIDPAFDPHTDCATHAGVALPASEIDR